MATITLKYKNGNLATNNNAEFYKMITPRFNVEMFARKFDNSMSIYAEGNMGWSDDLKYAAHDAYIIYNGKVQRVVIFRNEMDNNIGMYLKDVDNAYGDFIPMTQIFPEDGDKVYSTFNEACSALGNMEMSSSDKPSNTTVSAEDSNDSADMQNNQINVNKDVLGILGDILNLDIKVITDSDGKINVKINSKNAGNSAGCNDAHNREKESLQMEIDELNKKIESINNQKGILTDKLTKLKDKLAKL